MSAFDLAEQAPFDQTMDSSRNSARTAMLAEPSLAIDLASPLEVFQITYHELPLLAIVEVRLPNSLVWTALLIGVVSTLAVLLASGDRLKPTLSDRSFGLPLAAVTGIIQSSALATALVPFYFALFSLLVVSNLGGMIPFSFTMAAQTSVTLATSQAIYFASITSGFIWHQERILDQLVPPSLPPILGFLVFSLEVAGYLARTISLGVRLSANIIAGHALLKLFGMLIWGLIFLDTSLSLTAAATALVPLLLLTGIETGVALVQSYVFTLLAATTILKTPRSRDIALCFFASNSRFLISRRYDRSMAVLNLRCRLGI
jgi:ATP synthase subunit 6